MMKGDKMNNKTMQMKSLLASLIMFAVHSIWAQENESADSNPFNSVVKLEVITSSTNARSPWKKDEGASCGSGVVIGDGRILTCAHCVTDATFIRIRKSDEEAIYQGRIKFISHSCDLAIVEVVDPKFMQRITPCAIGDTPPMQTQVLAVGFPLGGDGISYTRGIVSRVEEIEYRHSLRDHLAIQVDAAINPGNSGGPVFNMNDGRIAGIAFQGNKEGESLGYLIPPDVINHFLKDIQDGRVDGFEHAQFQISGLENEEARRYLKMTELHTGCEIVDVSPLLGTNSIKRGDVLMSIGGYAVANNGYIRIDGNERRAYWYPLRSLQIGETCPVVVLRKGRELNFTLTASKRNPRIRPFVYEREADYYVFGGYVFTTVSLSFLECEPRFGYGSLCDEKRFPDDEPVALADVMADEVTEGYLGMGGTLVRTLNGVEVKNIRHLIELIENSKDEYLHLEVDGGRRYLEPIYIKREQQLGATKRIMNKYAIPADRSPDLLKRE